MSVRQETTLYKDEVTYMSDEVGQTLLPTDILGDGILGLAWTPQGLKSRHAQRCRLSSL